MREIWKEKAWIHQEGWICNVAFLEWKGLSCTTLVWETILIMNILMDIIFGKERLKWNQHYLCNKMTIFWKMTLGETLSNVSQLSYKFKHRETSELSRGIICPKESHCILLPQGTAKLWVVNL